MFQIPGGYHGIPRRDGEGGSLPPQDSWVAFLGLPCLPSAVKNTIQDKSTTKINLWYNHWQRVFYNKNYFGFHKTINWLKINQVTEEHVSDFLSKLHTAALFSFVNYKTRSLQQTTVLCSPIGQCILKYNLKTRLSVNLEIPVDTCMRHLVIFQITKIKSYCWKGVQLLKRKESVSKSIWNYIETGNYLSWIPRDYNTYVHLNVAIYTDFFFFSWSFDISWKYNMTLRSLGKTCIIKHNYIDLCFWLLTRFISLRDIIMSWICWSQYVSCQ